MTTRPSTPLTSLYAEVALKVAKMTPGDRDDWVEIYNLMRKFRLELSCKVCAQFPVDAVCSPKCLHMVCKQCVGETMQLIEPCVDCSNDASKYGEHKMMNIMLHLYRFTCGQLLEHRCRPSWGTLDDETNARFMNLVTEGVCPVSCDCKFHLKDATTSTPSPSSAVPSVAGSFSQSSPSQASPSMATQEPRVLPLRQQHLRQQKLSSSIRSVKVCFLMETQRH
ncbi:hypothetical protein MRX96_049183 [Rhipicephalus microplus]